MNVKRVAAGIAVAALVVGGAAGFLARGQSQSQREASCYRDAYGVAVTALRTGVATNALPSSCEALDKATQDRLGRALGLDLYPMLWQSEGVPTPEYARVLGLPCGDLCRGA